MPPDPCRCRCPHSHSDHWSSPEKFNHGWTRSDLMDPEVTLSDRKWPHRAWKYSNPANTMCGPDCTCIRLLVCSLSHLHDKGCPDLPPHYIPESRIDLQWVHQLNRVYALIGASHKYELVDLRQSLLKYPWGAKKAISEASMWKHVYSTNISTEMWTS